MYDSELKCHFLDIQKWTVGDIQKLICKSQKPILLTSSVNIHLKDSSLKHALKVLKIESKNDHEFILHVTGYKVGQYHNKEVVLADAKNSYSMGDLSWEINSILKPGQQPQFHPPYGPFKENLPYWYSISWILFFILFFVFITHQIHSFLKRKKRKKMVLEKLKDKTPLQYFISQLSSFINVSNDHRKEFLSDLRILLLDFLENKFLIESKKCFKKVNNLKNQMYRIKVNRKQKKELLKIYTEICKMEEDYNRYSKKDLIQITDMVREWVFNYESIS